ncbi:hypothetical protein IFO69_17755 [Echinicola sp. CAU 1574]|uniref:Cytochrome B n=1 Tax=Echinicola arenosa TaxID=2774144 RepID=A0ABR9AP90_9BACT|nr:hypothetical protein [Echinicola arenosa]MBD8490603.1 hypothetical protein [Echinicola arenosa]
MLYTTLLSLHSIVRWLVLASVLVAVFRIYRGWFTNRPFDNFDEKSNRIAVSMLHLQFTIGALLYFLSPIIRYFYQHYNEAVHERQIRFFGMEHSSMMFLAVFVISMGVSLAKKKDEDQKKFKILGICYTVGILLILINIPWPFSPFAARPYLRFF